MTTVSWEAEDFSLADLRRDVVYSCLLQPGRPRPHDRLDPLGFTLRPPILRRLARWGAVELDQSATRLVAVGLSALGFAVALALEVNVPVSVSHNREVVGETDHADRVVLVADFTTTWATAQQAVDDVTAGGAKVIQSMVVWDRSPGSPTLPVMRLPTVALLTDDSVGTGLL
jgi:orotate phosphoribosyltransferase